MVAVERLEVRSGRRVLVSPFSWTHTAGSIAWLVGENGTGKSSLLRVLAGRQRSSRGRVRWLGIGARVRYYTPAMSAPADLRVKDWTDFVSWVQTADRATDSIEALRPRTANPGRRFGDLSTGEAKRFLLWGLLRLPHGPLVLDEPYEHLSREAKHALTESLRIIARDTVMVVATNQEIPLQGDEVLLSLDGTEIQWQTAL
jgi:ABC-type transport system involved in cytochrome c biogenesis ATPase subunit